MSENYYTAHRTSQDRGEARSRRHPPRASAYRKKLRIYSESLSGLNEDYVAQTLRLIALDAAAITNMNMIDSFMQRLAPLVVVKQPAPSEMECPA